MDTIVRNMLRRGFYEAAQEFHLRWPTYRPAKQVALIKKWS